MFIVADLASLNESCSRLNVLNAIQLILIISFNTAFHYTLEDRAIEL